MKKKKKIIIISIIAALVIVLSILIVLLVMRLAYLRIFIAISPVVVLVYALDITSIKKLKDILDLKKVIVLIFKPAIFALWISLMFIVVVTVHLFITVYPDFLRYTRRSEIC